MQFYPLRLYVGDRAVAILLSSSILLNIAAWVWLVARIHPSAQPLFLHYNILFGIDAIGSWSRIFSAPLAGSVILLANAVIGFLVFGKDKYVAYFLNALSTIIGIHLLFAVSALITLNT